jgi:hypothetical protein
MHNKNISDKIKVNIKNPKKGMPEEVLIGTLQAMFLRLYQGAYSESDYSRFNNIFILEKKQNTSGLSLQIPRLLILLKKLHYNCSSQEGLFYTFKFLTDLRKNDQRLLQEIINFDNSIEKYQNLIKRLTIISEEIIFKKALDPLYQTAEIDILFNTSFSDDFVQALQTAYEDKKTFFKLIHYQFNKAHDFPKTVRLLAKILLYFDLHDPLEGKKLLEATYRNFVSTKQTSVFFESLAQIFGYLIVDNVTKEQGADAFNTISAIFTTKLAAANFTDLYTATAQDSYLRTIYTAALGQHVLFSPYLVQSTLLAAKENCLPHTIFTVIHRGLTATLKISKRVADTFVENFKHSITPARRHASLIEKITYFDMIIETIARNPTLQKFFRNEDNIKIFRENEKENIEQLFQSLSSFSAIETSGTEVQVLWEILSALNEGSDLRETFSFIRKLTKGPSYQSSAKLNSELLEILNSPLIFKNTFSYLLAKLEPEAPKKTQDWHRSLLNDLIGYLCETSSRAENKELLSALFIKTLASLGPTDYWKTYSQLTTGNQTLLTQHLYANNKSILGLTIETLGDHWQGSALTQEKVQTAIKDLYTAIIGFELGADLQNTGLISITSSNLDHFFQTTITKLPGTLKTTIVDYYEKQVQKKLNLHQTKKPETTISKEQPPINGFAPASLIKRNFLSLKKVQNPKTNLQAYNNLTALTSELLALYKSEKLPRTISSINDIKNLWALINKTYPVRKFNPNADTTTLYNNKRTAVITSDFYHKKSFDAHGLSLILSCLFAQLHWTGIKYRIIFNNIYLVFGQKNIDLTTGKSISNQALVKKFKGFPQASLKRLLKPFSEGNFITFILNYRKMIALYQASLNANNTKEIPPPYDLLNQLKNKHPFFPLLYYWKGKIAQVSTMRETAFEIAIDQYPKIFREQTNTTYIDSEYPEYSEMLAEMPAETKQNNN